MQRDSMKLFYDSHSWIGVVAGLLLYVVSFSGIPAMFAEELELWQADTFRSQPAAEGPMQWDQWLQWAQQRGLTPTAGNSVFIFPHQDAGIIWARQRQDNEANIDRYFSAINGEPLDPGASDLSHLLEHLHTDLHLPSPYGRYLVGFAGMLMLLSLVAGVVIHNKWRQQLTTLRIKRSWRLLLTDHHKLMGLWSLPFAFILGFTGTILGLLGLISPILALAKFDGDVGAAVQAILGPEAEVVHISAEQQSLDALYAQALEVQPHLKVNGVELSGWGDEGALVSFAGTAQAQLSNLQTVTLSAVTGELIHQSDATAHGPFYRLFAAVTPLHYVMFGDVVLKYFYALCTLVLAFVILSGMFIWLDKQQRTRANDHWLADLTLGVAGGLPLAIGWAFAVTAMAMGQTDLAQLESRVFWGSWLLAMLATPVASKLGMSRHRQTRLLLLLTGIGLLTAVLADGMVSDNWLWQPVNTNAGGVVWTLAISALLLFWAAWSLPSQQQREQQRNRSRRQPDVHNSPVEQPPAQ